MYDKLMNAIFDAYCDGEYPEEISAEINNTIRYFSDALHTTPAKVDAKITAPICTVERYAFMQGFCACLELVLDSLGRDKKHE